MNSFPPKVKFRSEISPMTYSGNELRSTLYLKMSGDRELVMKVRDAIREVLQANIKLNDKNFDYDGED